jgi:hypothetical protein
MAQEQLDLQLTEQARIALSSLGQEDRRLVSAWFDHLRNWRNDEHVRARSRRLPADGEVFALRTSGDLVIAFQLAGDQVTVLTILRERSLGAFAAPAGQRAS